MPRRLPAVLLAALVGLPLAAVPGGRVAVAAAAATPASEAAAAYARMTTNQRIGQLFMVNVPSTGTSRAQRALLRRYAVGNVILIGASDAGVTATASVVAKLRPAATQAGVRPLVATDQEGGFVQHLQGPGFDRMPTALTQGGWTPTKLRRAARRWAGELGHAGVNLDLAPVADVVPRAGARQNQPIGRFDREFGHRPKPVAEHVVAFVRGMREAGLLTTVKHFPGLGRATGNTDDAAGVTDPTTRHDAYLQPFQAGVDVHVPFVMVSTATYPNIDPHHQAAFSKTIVTSMLRGDLGFTGVVISDSLTTTSVQSTSYAHRALRFLRAGGDVILLTSTAPVRAMTSAIRSELQSSARFRKVVHAAVMAVLLAKARAGLLDG